MTKNRIITVQGIPVTVLNEDIIVQAPKSQTKKSNDWGVGIFMAVFPTDR